MRTVFFIFQFILFSTIVSAQDIKEIIRKSDEKFRELQAPEPFR